MSRYEERFFSRFRQVGDSPLDCWEWTAGTSANGRGYFHSPKGEPAYRWSWRFFRGEIPEGLDLDHLCRNKLCVNPWHLDPATRAENVRRQAGATVTHCAHGHDRAIYTVRLSSGRTRCKECTRLYQRALRRSRGVRFIPGKARADADV